MKYPRVRDVIIEYDRGGIQAVSKFLHQSELTIDPSTWVGQVKKDIVDKNFFTAISKIELLSYKFIKKHNEEENSRPGE